MDLMISEIDDKRDRWPWARDAFRESQIEEQLRVQGELIQKLYQRYDDVLKELILIKRKLIAEEWEP